MKLSLTDVVPALEQEKVRAFVLYGNNPVLIQGVLQEINACFSHETIPFDRLKMYLEDLETPLLFGKKPYVLHLEGGTAWSTCVPILRSWPKHHAIVVQAASFPATWSKFPDIAAVACYDCTHEESRKMVRRYSLRDKIPLSADALDWCAGIAQSGQWHSMLSVLSLAAGGGKTLSLQDVQAIFPESWDEDQLAILDGGKHALDGVDDPVKVLRSWQRVVMQLWQLKQLLGHHTPEQAIESVRPVIFFKHKARLVRAAETWSKMKIMRCLGLLIQTETAIKKGTLPAQDMLERLLRQC